MVLIDELIERHKKDEFVECFSSGTAVIVSPIRNIEYQGVDYEVDINETYQAGDLTYQIFREILDIQEGRIKDKFGWSKVIS